MFFTYKMFFLNIFYIENRDDSDGVDGDDSRDGGDGNYKAAGWRGYSENGARNRKLVLIMVDMVTISGGSRLAWTNTSPSWTG
jgi:hypothetical protein